MNLFTTYTPEETKILLEVGRKKSFVSKQIPFFQGVDTNKLNNFHSKKINKRDLIKEYEFVFVKKGKIGVVKNGKVIKILKENDCFGLLNVFLKEQYILIALEDSEVIFFGVGDDIQMYYNLLECISRKLKDKIIL